MHGCCGIGSAFDGDSAMEQNVYKQTSVEYLSWKCSHNGKCSHVQCHPGTSNKLLLVDLVAAAYHVTRTTACLHYYCSITWTTRGHTVSFLMLQIRWEKNNCMLARERFVVRLHLSLSNSRSTSPMIWPTLCSAFRSSSVLSKSFFEVLTLSRTDHKKP